VLWEKVVELSLLLKMVGMCNEGRRESSKEPRDEVDQQENDIHSPSFFSLLLRTKSELFSFPLFTT